MGLYIRKSFSLGPIRFNLSKSGIGISAGVKGARFGVDARGKKYVHVGRGGIYYRDTLPENSQVDVDDSSPRGSGVGWGTVLLVLAALYVIFCVLA